MIVDTSAVPAILLGEPDAEHYEQMIATAWPRHWSVAALLEAAMVVKKPSGLEAGHELDALPEKAVTKLTPATL